MKLAFCGDLVIYGLAGMHCISWFYTALVLQYIIVAIVALAYSKAIIMSSWNALLFIMWLDG